jgi:gamma-glutamylcyclotransferase (GGCT)/AIG2-like uncharacterized protein YtfP
MNLFTYGTLMFPEVWKRIDIGEFVSTPAILHGFAIYRVRDTVFPGIVRASATDQVRGLTFLDLDEATLFEIDTYETGFYERIDVTATLDSGAEVPCSVYVIPDSRRHELTDDSWDALHFKEKELEKYLNG